MSALLHHGHWLLFPTGSGCEAFDAALDCAKSQVLLQSGDDQELQVAAAQPCMGRYRVSFWEVKLRRQESRCDRK